MKKIFVSAFTVLMLLAVPQPTNAQAFLNKMKEKAEQAASNAANKMLQGTKAGEAMKANSSSNGSNSSSSYSMQADDSHDAETSEEKTMMEVNQQASRMERQTKHVGNWNTDLVTPSAAKFPVPLMNELPAIPSAQEIANPTEAAQKAYYMAIQKVALRAQQLSEDETCSKEATDLYLAQYKQKMMKAFNLSEREYAIYSGEIQGTEKEQEAVMQKVLGFDAEALMAAFSDVENMSEAEREAKAKEMAGDMLKGSQSAASKVYSKYPTEMKKYFGKTPAEASQLMDQSMKLAMSGKEKEADAMSKKFEAEVKAHQKTLSAADQKAAKDFESKVQKELQEEMKNAARSSSPLGAMMAGMEEARKKQQEVEELKKKHDDYRNALANAVPDYVSSTKKDYEFAAADRKKVESLKAKIMASDDPSVYNPLFAEAHEIIKTYRVRAAQVWRADVEKRFNGIKSALPNMIKVNRQAIEDKIIPECMLYRAPLNMVLQACETLEDAYTEVPVDYPALYQAEVVRQVKISSDEQVWWPEFYVAETVSNILAGKTLFKSSKGHVYQFNAGKWVNADNMKQSKTLAGDQNAKSQKWTSSDGKRTVTYVEEGSYFLLPEGDIIQPRAIEKQGNTLVWADTVEEEDKDGNTIIKIVKYTYKL